VADHAYWVSGMSVRDPKKSPDATFDARSEAFGTGDGKPTGQRQGAGTLNGGSHGPMPYVERSQDWEAAPATPKADRLDVVATNVATATVDAARARLSCAPELNVKTDGPLDLHIDCSKSVVKGARCSSRVSFRLPHLRGMRTVKVVVSHKGQRLKAVKGKDLRSVSLRRLSRKPYSVKVRMNARGKHGRTGTVVLTRRVSGC
jgi:hypothetical protein